MNGLTPNDGNKPVTAPFSVDAFAGEHRGDVSRQWASRPHDQKFNTLSDLYNTTKARADASFEGVYTTHDFAFGAPDIESAVAGMEPARAAAEARRLMGSCFIDLKQRSGGDVVRHQTVSPSHWSFGQACGLAKAPGDFLRELPSATVADALNWRLRHARAAETVKILGSGELVRAFTSESYGRILDHEVVRACMTIAGDGLGKDGFHWKAPGRLTPDFKHYDPWALGPKDDRTFYASDRDVFVFLVDDTRPILVGKTRDGRDDHMFRGFFVQNSEVGSRALKISAFYLRGVCMNRNLWGVENFKEITIRHTRLAPERWLQEAQPALESFANRSDATLIEGVERAKAKIVADDDAAALAFLKGLKGGLNERNAKAIIDISEREEGAKPRSAWDFGQAITAFARDIPNTDKRLEVELIAKNVFDLVA